MSFSLAHCEVKQSAARRYLARAVASLILAVPIAGHTGALELTLSEAQRQALSRSRQLVAQDYAEAASRDMAVAAAQLPDPVLKAGIENLPVEGPDRFSLGADFMTMRRIGVMQELTRADKRRWRSERFARQAERIDAEKSAIAARIERETAIAWFERYYAERMAAEIDQLAQQARYEIEAAEAAYRGGKGSQADILAARGSLVAVQDRHSEFRQRIRSATAKLARWIGDASSLPLASAPVTDTVRLDVTSLDSELAHHPEIAVLGRQEALAQAEANVARANKKSDWTVEVAFLQRGSAYSNMVSVGVSLPLQWDQSKRQNRELSSKLAMVEQVRAERDELLREHIAETRIWLQEWENGRERHQRYERELLPLANQRTLAALAGYRGGKGSLSDVLLARRNESDLKIQALQLQLEVARLWAHLNFLLPTDSAPHMSTTGEKVSK